MGSKPAGIGHEIECRLAQTDIELHEVEYRRESEGQILRIFIDKDSGVDLIPAPNIKGG